MSTRGVRERGDDTGVEIALDAADGLQPKTSRWSQLHLTWHRFSGFDWCVILGGCIVYAATMNIDPWNRSLELLATNPLINLPKKSETIPNWLLLVLSLLVPLGMFGVICAIQWKRPSARAEAYQACLAFLLAVIATLLCTNAIKKITGRPRPNFIALAGASYLPNSTTIVYSASHSEVVEAYQSYPSGHASLSMVGLGFLAFYLYYKLHPAYYAVPAAAAAAAVVSRGGTTGSSSHNRHIHPRKITPKILKLYQSPNNQAWKTIFCMLPGVLAIYIGLTRITDYYHNYDDVTLGWLVGLFWATYFWRAHFVPFQGYWASANLKRVADEYLEESDVVVGMGGHGDDMAEANLMDVLVTTPTSTDENNQNGHIVRRDVNNTQTAHNISTATAADADARAPGLERTRTHTHTHHDEPMVAVIQPPSSDNHPHQPPSSNNHPHRTSISGSSPNTVHISQSVPSHHPQHNDRDSDVRIDVVTGDQNV